MVVQQCCHKLDAGLVGIHPFPFCYAYLRWSVVAHNRPHRILCALSGLCGGEEKEKVHPAEGV